MVLGFFVVHGSCRWPPCSGGIELVDELGRTAAGWFRESLDGLPSGGIDRDGGGGANGGESGGYNVDVGP